MSKEDVEMKNQKYNKGLTRREFIKSAAMFSVATAVLAPMRKIDGKIKFADDFASDSLRHKIRELKKVYAGQAHDQLEKIMAEHNIDDPTEAGWELLQEAAAPLDAPNLSIQPSERRVRA